MKTHKSLDCRVFTTLLDKSKIIGKFIKGERVND